MEIRTRARVLTRYSPLGTARITVHLRPDRANGNMELVQKCTEPARLCGCKLVQECSPDHSRPRMANRVILKAYWKKSSQDREHQGYPKCRYNPSSSPRGLISPSLRSTRASIQPYTDIRPLDQSLSKNYAPCGQSPPKVRTLSRSRWPTYTWRLPWGCGGRMEPHSNAINHIPMSFQCDPHSMLESIYTYVHVICIICVQANYAPFI